MPFFTEAVAVSTHDPRVLFRRREWGETVWIGLIEGHFYVLEYMQEPKKFRIKHRAHFHPSDYLQDDWTWSNP